MSAYVGGFAVGSIGTPSTLISDPPTVVITAPIGSIDSAYPTITWTYNSAVARPQAWYRIVIEIDGQGNVYDSGMIEGAATSIVLGFALSSFTSYLIHVGVSDGLSGGEDPVGTSSGWDVTAVSGEFSEVLVSDNELVGSVYEIGIAGVGYMLQDTTDKPVQRTAALLPSQAPGSDSQFSEEVDRYRFIAHADFTLGEGQLYLDRPSSSPSRYWYSEWINPFEPGEASLNPVPELHIADTFVAGAVREHQHAVVASGYVFYQTANSSMTAQQNPSAAPTSEFATGTAGSLTGTASDGANWYATDGASIRRNTSAANPGSDWSTVDVTEIAWCTDRLAGLDTAASPPNFTTFSAAGAEENVGGWQSFTGATLRGLCGGDGYIWFGVNYVDTGHIRAWQVGSGAGTSIIGLTLPEGETVDSLYFYLGNVFASTSVNEAPYNRKIYRCVGIEGKLTPQLLLTIPGNNSAAHRRTWFAGRDKFVAFGWPSLTANDASGIGVINLETSGYARWQSAGAANLPVAAVVSWGGDFGFVLEANTGDGGFYGAGNSPDLHDGYLITSVSDLSSNSAKILDSVSVTTRPLAGEVSVSYSLTTNETFFPVGDMIGVGSTTIEWPLTVQGSSFGFKVELEANDEVGPVLKRVAGKVHLRSISDQVIVYPVNCGDTISGLNNVTITPDSHPGAGMERVEALEALVGNMVAVQDVNWPQTHESQSFQVMSVETTLTGQFDQNKNYRVDHGVAVVTLRRPLS